MDNGKQHQSDAAFFILLRLSNQNCPVKLYHKKQMST